MPDKRVGLGRKLWRVGEGRALGASYCLAYGGCSTEVAHQLSVLKNFTCSSRTVLDEIQTQLPNSDRWEIPEVGD